MISMAQRRHAAGSGVRVEPNTALGVGLLRARKRPHAAWRIISLPGPNPEVSSRISMRYRHQRYVQRFYHMDIA